MRRTVFVVVAVAAFVVAMSSPLEAASGQRVSGRWAQDWAHGGINAIGLGSDAGRGGPGSENAMGSFSNWWSDQLVYRVRVTCLAINGDMATVGGEIISSEVFPGHVGSGLILFVVDGGEFGVGDQLGHSLNSEPQPLPGAECPTPYAPGWPLTSGDIEISGGS
jgi:hypothetical protein